VIYVVSATPYTDSLRLNIMWRDGSGRPHMLRADAPLVAAMDRLQTDPAGRVVGLRVPAPWVGSATLMGPRGWVLNISGYPTHR
jgi:hypothetical protein